MQCSQVRTDANKSLKGQRDPALTWDVPQPLEEQATTPIHQVLLHLLSSAASPCYDTLLCNLSMVSKQFKVHCAATPGCANSAWLASSLRAS